MSLYDKLMSSDNPERDFGTMLDRTTIENRFLTNCVFELTPVCNFRCPFCYARISPEELRARGVRVLTTDEWKRIIDELREMNCLNLTFTGGECTIRQDFCEIYEYAYDSGFMVSILTNGSLISPEILSLFKQKSPYRMYITVYGAIPETYEKVCGSKRFYTDVRENISALVNAHIPVIVQFTADKDNIGEMTGVYNFAKELGVPFRYSRLLTEFGRCTSETIEEVNADKGEFFSASKEIWLDSHEKDGKAQKYRQGVSYHPDLNKPVIERGIPCNAGRNSCFINHRGELTPCVMIDAFSADTAGRNIKDCWHDCVAWADEVPRITECTNCLYTIKCKHCIALHYNDTKKFGVPSPRLCYKHLYPERAAQIERQYLHDGYLSAESTDVF